MTTVLTVPGNDRGSGAIAAPETFGVEFLHWLREATERAWAEIEVRDYLAGDPSVPGFRIGPQWRRGTHWTGGLDEATIAGIEHRYGVRFPPDYRLFLHTLHSTTPPMMCTCYKHAELSAHNEPGFYNWQRDEIQIRKAMHRVADTMRELPYDLQSWQTTWSHRDSKPALIPIFGHRYIVADPAQWVLSIVDDDAIIYGENLRDYLLNELDDVLR